MYNSVTNCARCGIEFVVHSPNRKFCDQCQPIRKQEMEALAYRKNRERDKQEKHISYIRVKRRKQMEEKKKVVGSIAQISRAAREQGMSYGEYVAKQYMKQQ